MNTDLNNINHKSNFNILPNNILSQKIELLINKLKKQQVFSLSTFISIDPLNAMMDNKIQDEIYIIIHEQIENIIKFAKANYVHIELYMQNKNLIIEVNNDGIGFDFEKATVGMGLKNIFKQINKMNGTCLINTTPGNGCTCKINIPLESNDFGYPV